MHIVILGNGISGITAARHLRKGADHRITIVSDESPYFFSRTALMYVYMGHMRAADLHPYEAGFWKKNRLELVKERVTHIDFAQKKLHMAAQKALTYDVLVLCTGSVPNKLGWPGQDLAGVQGLYHWQDLESMERASKGLQRAVIVGGGLIGIEMAEMFHSRHIPVTFLVRESSFWNGVLPAEESAMVTRHLREHGLDIRLSTELVEILPNAEGHCRAVVTNKGETIPCGFVGLTTGVRPNIDFLKGSPLDLQKGILVDEYLATNVPHVYAIGDCAELRQPPAGRRAIEAVWYVGRLMGACVARTILGERTRYTPGIWFNSAKFLDIEYQVYGDIRTQLPPEQAALYWEHPSAKKSIRIHYERPNGAVVGFHVMGIRYRQAICERWIAEKAPIETVLAQLPTANFDPEFSEHYEAKIAAAYFSP